MTNLKAFQHVDGDTGAHRDLECDLFPRYMTKTSNAAKDEEDLKRLRGKDILTEGTTTGIGANW